VIATRHIDFEACFNFRDLGGYAGLDGRAMRWGRLYRSMTPQYMTSADALRAANLGIELVVDLRGERYASSGPIGEPPALRVAAGPANAWGSAAELEAFLTLDPEDALPKVLEIYGAFFATGLRAIAEHPEGAVLFHCRLGKDRTGVFAALLLKLAGVADDDIIADYMLTQRDEQAMRELILRAEAESPVREGRLMAEPVRREAIEAVLQRLVSKYGGAYGYFARYGVEAGTLGVAVEGLLEPSKS
jgi:protein tyrosine/serine phosphatase